MPYELEPFDIDVETLPYLNDPDHPSNAERVTAPKGGADSDRWTLNFGPQHPATHTTLRLVLELDGERVARANPHIGYLHSGFEKLGEHLDYNQYVTIVSRMDYISPISNDIAWHHAVEMLFGVELTTRCKVIRTIMAELGRIQNHLLCVGAAALDLGAFTAFLYGFNERERIYDIVEYVSGQRFHPDWTRVGGAFRDLADQDTFIRMVKSFLYKDLKPAMDDITGLLNTNRIFRDRSEGVGVISKEDAIAWSLSGPNARSAGVAKDIRKEEPYLCYADNWDNDGAEAVTFDVPIATTGDCFARYLVRLEEMRQSIGIIEQLIDRIPGGSINANDDGKLNIPSKGAVYGSIEGLIQLFEIVMDNRGWKAPVAELYAANETANGELGYYLVSDGGPNPFRARCRPPSYINYAVFPKLIEGHLLSDVVAVLGSLNIIAAELDR